ncbi:hypothetical protein BS78_K014300 [Paspalum vaginatum]|uniref:Uncharacterized protein n=1 Tax=Paspalum vaginatum TaxID=158149 RepID=A0A9W7X8S8_9POAL|nr:hypothetical protein BS78_K014300 [Paspalum vaginatum]
MPCIKKRHAPGIDMVHHWIEMPKTNMPINITSLVTRIAFGLGILENAQLEYIPDDMTHIISEQHFILAHIMKRDKRGNLVMTYFGHILEIPLLAPQYGLYRVKSLTMQLDMEAPGQSIGGVMTRGPTATSRISST